ncbi:hypothetical protein CDL15_Pgr005244 [Punica granatum]|uniref:Uncharacterized protein n=1 Tax=Punica granatum TaxID=22663 RepID=A0A218WPA5_PUNGR|nr:hypothetical protein CDL15_Pgr005244 [Punica granatum]
MSRLRPLPLNCPSFSSPPVSSVGLPELRAGHRDHAPRWPWCPPQHPPTVAQSQRLHIEPTPLVKVGQPLPTHIDDARIDARASPSNPTGACSVPLYFQKGMEEFMTVVQFLPFYTFLSIASQTRCCTTMSDLLNSGPFRSVYAFSICSVRYCLQSVRSKAWPRYPFLSLVSKGPNECQLLY